MFRVTLSFYIIEFCGSRKDGPTCTQDAWLDVYRLNRLAPALMPPSFSSSTLTLPVSRYCRYLSYLMLMFTDICRLNSARWQQKKYLNMIISQKYFLLLYYNNINIKVSILHIILVLYLGDIKRFWIHAKLNTDRWSRLEDVWICRKYHRPCLLLSYVLYILCWIASRSDLHLTKLLCSRCLRCRDFSSGHRLLRGT